MWFFRKAILITRVGFLSGYPIPRKNSDPEGTKSRIPGIKTPNPGDKNPTIKTSPESRGFFEKTEDKNPETKKNLKSRGLKSRDLKNPESRDKNPDSRFFTGDFFEIFKSRSRSPGFLNFSIQPKIKKSWSGFGFPKKSHPK